MRLSPIYRKDELVASRSYVFPMIVAGFNGILSILLLLNLFSVRENALASGEIGYVSFLQMYYVVALIEFALILLIGPALTVSAISGERERKTLELLLTTQLSASEIVIGKLLSALSTVGTLIISSLPVLATVFIYGGVTLTEVLMLLFIYLVCALYCTAVGLCASAYVSATAAATAAAYVVIFVTALCGALVHWLREPLGIGGYDVWVILAVLLFLTALMIYGSERKITPKRQKRKGN